MTDKDMNRLLRLANEMALVIDRYQGMMKPREADKARQMKKMIKKLLKKIEQ